MKAAERWTEYTKRLPPLVVDIHVRIQNQTGAHPTQWDKTGVVIEVRQFDQYIVRDDGSGRITIRNRKFLKKYIQCTPRHTINDDLQRITKPPFQPTTAHLPKSAYKPSQQPTPSHNPPNTTPITQDHPVRDITTYPNPTTSRSCRPSTIQTCESTRTS